ncbi:unnamed protein product [Rotaria sordida]|uniref:Uncharacterized protein n=1 Tax=Rotaria sordida TaxID=392033 RepID=A0A819SVP3_9BILA|nr:unnamed protein product [Rotaria sordida]CAF1452743.1 unnamed protein product [Rotaria sordida]CAF1535687.1 unnamed protein product [Rotaria sordida]CAF3910841.1 unnamed protein product [Rotaria sordida]CAF4068324.1 unnamed protein product [Rotaria sordida]
MDVSTVTNVNRRKRVPHTIFTPTQSSNVISNYCLLYFIETESYQIAARSSIKKFDEKGFAKVLIRNKFFQGKIIHVDSLDGCEKELGRRTRLSQQDNTNNIDLDEQQEELDECNDEVASSITPSQRLFTT